MTVVSGRGTTVSHGTTSAFETSTGRIARQTLVYLAGSIVPQLMSFVLLPVFTRYLTASEYGTLAYSLTVGGFFSALGTFAIQPFVIRQYWLAKKVGDVDRMLSTVFGFIAILNLVLLGAASAALPPLFAWLDVQVHFAPFVQLALCSAVLQTLGAVPLSYFRATERPAVYVGLSALGSVLGGGLSLYLVTSAGLGLLGRLYGQLAADAAMVIVYVAVMARIGRLAWSGAYVRDALRYCMPLVPAQFLAMCAGMADRLVLERWVSLADLGVYSVAAAFTAGAPLLSSGVFSAMQPSVARLATNGELDRQVPRIKRYLVWLLMFLMCGVIALSRDALYVIAGPAFSDSHKVALLLIPAILVQSFITNIPSQYLTATGQTRFETPSRLAGALAGLLSMFVLVPSLGIFGAGLASIVTALATLAVYSRFVTRLLPIDWRFRYDLANMAAAAAIGLLIGQIEMPGLLLTIGVKGVLVACVSLVYLASVSPEARLAVASVPAWWSVQRS